MVNVVATITISAVAYSVYSRAADAVVDADAYFAARLGATDWSGATTLVKQQALITAARDLDRSVKWDGTKTVSTQALEFPRDGLEDCYGNALAANTIPDGIVFGQYELALKLIADPTLQDSPIGTGSNIRRVQAGSAAVEFFRPTIGTAVDFPFPRVVWDHVKCFVANAGAGSGLGGSVIYGDDEVSSFTDCRRFGLTGPNG